MSDPRILTIVLNYKTAQMTLKAAASARAAMQGLPGEIVIVDNDSQDGSFDEMAAHIAAEGWDTTRVIQSGRNGGYGAGNNVGIRAGMADGSKPDYVYILNSDAFPKPDAIKVLYDHLNTTPTTGFAGSYIEGEDEVQHLTTFRFPSIWSEFEGSIHFGPVSKLLKSHRVPRDLNETAQVDWLAGASVMMRQDILDEIGLFDETFFLYFEETDLCLRAQKAGHQIMYLADSIVTHIGSVSTGMKEWKRVPEYWFDSRWYYFSKNHGRAYAACATSLHLIGGSLNWVRRKLTGKTPGGAPHFLRTMARHDAAALFKFQRSRPPEVSPQIGE
ncbi:glycosyltransferase family 2 protein [Loktanella sp. Alg231-35]|uniref:glycosyltransferase family 2 protein n=1 Tax=Loktanella sp. Alg231-35 TaxID=1922220 RepID=UPI000D5517AB|nr:glycosyltransferase family 2 protein [Loktanella sp. Alg231-35]